MLKKQTILAHVSLMAYRKCTAAQQVPDALSRTDAFDASLEGNYNWKCYIHA